MRIAVGLFPVAGPPYPKELKVGRLELFEGGGVCCCLCLARSAHSSSIFLSSKIVRILVYVNKMFWVVLAIMMYFYTMLGAGLVSARRARELIATRQVRTIVDVRTSTEFNTGHYPGAVNVPVNRISDASTRTLNRDGVLVYCNTGQRARLASQKLRALGFENVYYIAGTYHSLTP
jgi:phage shock protein E